MHATYNMRVQYVATGSATLLQSCTASLKSQQKTCNLLNFTMFKVATILRKFSYNYQCSERFVNNLITCNITCNIRITAV